MGVRRLIGFALLFCVLGAVAKPVDLLSCFADAAENDPTYQAQVAIYLAQKQVIPEAVSAVLPQVTLSAAIAREYEEQGQLGKGTFKTHSYGLLANQTLFNYTQFQQIKQAKFTVRSAFATLSAQQQDLMSRTAKGYLDVLQAYDLLRFTKEQKRYIAEQFQATKTLFEHHDATITDLEQAQGAVELINAEYYSAQISLYDTIQTLSELTGIRYQAFSYLNSDFPLIRPDPEKLETWVQIANAQNWYLQASRWDIGVAREALNATRGNFLPSISATGGFTKSEVPSLLLVDSVPNNTNNIGFNANWNFFQGGLTVAQVNAGKANLQQAEANMRKQYLKSMADTRKAYNTIIVGVSLVKSARAALLSNTKALQYAQQAYRAGELTITEILQIQYQLYRAQQQYVVYVYNYLFNIVLLKQAAGILDVKTLAEVNRWLVH